MEKKKRHPNFIDIIFVVLIAAVALIAYFLSHSTADADQAVVRSYTLELAELDPGMAGTVEAGDAVVDNIKNYAIGTVTAVEVIPAQITVLNEEGEKYQLSEVPNKITLLVTIEAQTLEDEKNISTVTGYNLKVGTLVSCSIGELSASGYILTLDR